LQANKKTVILKQCFNGIEGSIFMVNMPKRYKYSHELYCVIFLVYFSVIKKLSISSPALAGGIKCSYSIHFYSSSLYSWKASKKLTVCFDWYFFSAWQIGMIQIVCAIRSYVIKCTGRWKFAQLYLVCSHQYLKRDMLLLGR